MGALGTTRAKGFGTSNLRVAWGRRLKDAVHKQRQRHDIRGQHRDVLEGLFANIVTLRPTLQRSRRVISQRRDVPESGPTDVMTF